MVWLNLGINVVNSLLLGYYIVQMRRYKHPTDRTDEILKAIGAERRHFGNIESFWNAKWRLMRSELTELQYRIRNFFHGSNH